MEMPKPGEAHARLRALVGRWTGRETLHPAPWDPAGGPATTVVENRSILGGWAVVQEYQQRRNGVANFSGHGVFWFDPGTQQYVMHWIDSMGGTAGEYRGVFDGDVLRLVSALPQGGYSRCSFDCGTPDRYLFTLEISRDGSGWAPAIEGDYTKSRAAAARSPQRRALPRSAAKTTAKSAARGAARKSGGAVRRAGAARARHAGDIGRGKRKSRRR
jgi:hypothetical protein